MAQHEPARVNFRSVEVIYDPTQFDREGVSRLLADLEGDYKHWPEAFEWCFKQYPDLKMEFSYDEENNAVIGTIPIPGQPMRAKSNNEHKSRALILTGRRLVDKIREQYREYTESLKGQLYTLSNHRPPD